MLLKLCGCVAHVTVLFSTFRRMVVEEYERTISEIISERERARVLHDIEMEKITSEKNQTIDDLKSAERAFNNVHRYQTNQLSVRKGVPAHLMLTPQRMHVTTVVFVGNTSAIRRSYLF